MTQMPLLLRAWAETEIDLKSYNKKVLIDKVSVAFNEKQPTISLELQRAKVVFFIDYAKKNIAISLSEPKPHSLEYIIMCRLLLMRNLFPILPQPREKKTNPE